MDRVFLDANILFSAAYRENAGLARLWTLTNIRLLTSAYAIKEARNNLESDEQRARLDGLISSLELAFEPPIEAIAAAQNVQLPEKDVPILAAAIAGLATHLLTGDIRHFGPLFGTTVGAVLIQLPADYLRNLK